MLNGERAAVAVDGAPNIVVHGPLIALLHQLDHLPGGFGDRRFEARRRPLFRDCVIAIFARDRMVRLKRKSAVEIRDRAV
jgi:hydroxyacyl-ACP dehydratase HTD2-like protein with hotdog domain